MILGRRTASRADANYDKLEDWRLWPVHAVSGMTKDGRVFTSARIIEPQVTSQLQGDVGTVTASGTIPAVTFDGAMPLSEKIDYRRTFDIQPDGLEVATSVQAAGPLAVTELHETIPVFLAERKRQRDVEPTTIEFQSDDKWTSATPEYQQCSAVRLTRFDGTVLITFDKPRRVKLSPEPWNDTYLTRAACRNVMIDLLADNEKPGQIGSAEIRYRIEAGRKP